MEDYYFNDESRQGPRRLTEPRGRPRTRSGRPEELRRNSQNLTLGTFITLPEHSVVLKNRISDKFYNLNSYFL